MGILTWLRQLQEHFYQQPTISPSINWNDNGRYCNAQQKLAVRKGVNSIHMSKAAATSLHKVTSFDNIKPNKKDLNLVIKSLFDWAVRILHRDLPYVQDITNSIEGKKKQIKLGGLELMSKYTMRDDNFISTDGDDYINVEIKKVTPKQQEHKTEAQLMENVCKFMKNEIAKIETKNTDRVKVIQKDIDLHNNANLAAACLVQYVNEKSVNGPTFQSLEHMNQHMADEAATHAEEKEGDTSEDEEIDD